MRSIELAISKDNLKAAISDFMMSRALFNRDETIEEISFRTTMLKSDTDDVIPLTIKFSKEEEVQFKKW